MAASSNKYDKVSQPSVRARRASSLVSSPIYRADGRGLSSMVIGLIRCADMSDQVAERNFASARHQHFAILPEPAIICTRLQTFFFFIPYQYRPAAMISSGAVQFVRPHARRRRRKFFASKSLASKFLASKSLASKSLAGRNRGSALG
jgi:hypothetical protein